MGEFRIVSLSAALEKGKDPITALPEKRIIKRRPSAPRAFDL